MGYPLIGQSSKVGRKAQPCSTLIMGSVFKPLQEKWKEEKMGVRMRTGEGQQEEYRVSHMIFADHCYLFAASEEEIRKMIADTTEELRKRGSDWKEFQMELMAWGFGGKIGDVLLDVDERKNRIEEVETLQVMGAGLFWMAKFFLQK